MLSKWASGIKPTLELNFLGASSLDSRITYTNATANRTYYNSSGVLSYAAANTPRFDYNPSTLAARGLLIEEVRTNLFTYSEDFSNAIWPKIQATISTNTATSPDGTVTMDSLIEDAGAGLDPRIAFNITVASATVYTISLFAKPIAGSAQRYLQIYSNSGFAVVSAGVLFDLVTGTVVQQSANWSGSIQQLPNGIYRCIVTTPATNATTMGLRFRLSDQNTATVPAPSYTGDGASGFYLWGAQLEAGAFPTSYIATTSATVTRAADVATIGTLTPWYNASEGTLFIQAIPAGQTATAAYPVCFDDNSTNELIASYYILTNILGSFIQDGGATQLNMQNTSAITTLAVNKTAFAFKLNNFAASANGGSVQTSSSGTMPTPDRLRFGNRADSARPFTGWLQSIKYYPIRLPNSTLQGITA